MTAFKAIPPWLDFVKGRNSHMLGMRQEYVAKLQQMHEQTLRTHSALTTPEAEQAAYDTWTVLQAGKTKPAKYAQVARPYPACVCCMDRAELWVVSDTTRWRMRLLVAPRLKPLVGIVRTWIVQLEEAY